MEKFKDDGKTPRCQGNVVINYPQSINPFPTYLVHQCEFKAKFDKNKFCGNHKRK